MLLTAKEDHWQADRVRSARMATLGITWLVFAPLSAAAVLAKCAFRFGVGLVWPKPVALWLFLNALLLGDLARYLFCSAAGLVLALVALRWGKTRSPAGASLMLAILIVCTLPWIYNYRPALEAAGDREMLVPTQPGLLEGVVKRAQQAAEITPCTYSLLGWSEHGVLYYSEACAGRLPRIWAFIPGSGAQPREVLHAPEELETDGRWGSVLEWVRAPSWQPESEPAMRAGHLKGKHMASPDGRWVALVARHFYGPEDVLVIAGGGEAGE